MDDPDRPAAGPSPAPPLSDRDRRLAAALRENLRRRKARSRERAAREASSDPPGDGAAHPPEMPD